jgi:SsrA-binding protein
MKQIRNAKAYFDYEILEEEVAGMILSTMLVKKIASGHFTLTGNYVKIVADEMYMISEQEETIKLLVTKRQLNRFAGKVKEKGLSIVPLEVTQLRGRFKLKIGLAKGKKEYDKRQVNKMRDTKIEANRVVKSQKFAE